jgi:hypothetical protein
MPENYRRQRQGPLGSRREDFQVEWNIWLVMATLRLSSVAVAKLLQEYPEVCKRSQAPSLMYITELKISIIACSGALLLTSRTSDASASVLCREDATPDSENRWPNYGSKRSSLPLGHIFFVFYKQKVSNLNPPRSVRLPICWTITFGHHSR